MRTPLRQNSKHRLDFLRIATMKEEQSYNKLKEIEDVIKNHAAHINNTGILDDLLHEVAMAADQLEAKIEDHIGTDKISQQKFESNLSPPISQKSK